MSSLKIIILVLSGILLLNFVEGDLVITPGDITVLTGRSAYFNCSTNISNSHVRWYFYPVGSTERKIVYVKGKLSDNYVQRFRIENSSEGAYNLIILSVTLEDAGRYSCQEDEGYGDSVYAEQIVLDGDPVCRTSETTTGFVGDNSCGFQPDIIQLSCGIKYHGNRHPMGTWKKSGDDDPISVGVNYTKNSSHVDYMLTMNADISLNYKSYFCEINHSGINPYRCRNAVVINILYALDSNNSVVNKSKGEEIKCSANSSVPCNYKWKRTENGNEHVVSNGNVLRPDDSTTYKCEAECLFFTTMCTLTVMTVQVFSAEASNGHEMLALLVLPIALIVVVIVWLLLNRGRRMNIRELATCCASAAEESILGLTTSLVHNTESRNAQHEDDLKEIKSLLLSILAELKKQVEDKNKKESHLTTVCKNLSKKVEALLRMVGESERKWYKLHSVEINMEKRKTEVAELLKLIQTKLEDCKKKTENDIGKGWDWSKESESLSHRITQLEEIISQIPPVSRADEPDFQNIETTLDEVKVHVTKCGHLIKDGIENAETLLKKIDAECHTLKNAEEERKVQQENPDTDVLNMDKMKEDLLKINEKVDEYKRALEERSRRDESARQEWDETCQKIEKSSNELMKSAPVSQIWQREKWQKVKQEFFKVTNSTSGTEEWEKRRRTCQRIKRMIDDLLAPNLHYKEEELKEDDVSDWRKQCTLLNEHVSELIECCNEEYDTRDEKQEHTCLEQWDTKCKAANKVFESLATLLPDYANWRNSIFEVTKEFKRKMMRKQGISDDPAKGET